jgi:hypothetical protein
LDPGPGNGVVSGIPRVPPVGLSAGKLAVS